MSLPRTAKRRDGVPSMLPTLEKNASFSSEQILENRGRIAIFVDGASLFYAAYQLGIEIDYMKLLCRLTNGGRLLRAFFYTGIEPTNEKQRRFLQWMRNHGYRVVAKDVAQLTDGSKKVNLDVEIAVDLMALAPFYDTAVLLSGKGELAYAVNVITYRGRRVELVSLRSMTSDSLLNVCDRYIDLGSIKDDIQKTSNDKSDLSSDVNLILLPPEGQQT